MGKVKPRPDRTKKRKAVRRAELSTSVDPKLDPQSLISAALAFLQQGQPEAALPLAQQASANASSERLLALSLLGDINVELGDSKAAHLAFSTCADLDPQGMTPEDEGGGPEKFFWLAQLSESGGTDSIRWYEKGVNALQKSIELNEVTNGTETESDQEARKKKLATALCGMCEVWMTDLSFDDEAESQCEALISRAMLVSSTPHVSTLQTLASIRLSQSRIEDAQAALERSLNLWQDLDPESPDVPDFASRVSLARLLMEAGMSEKALVVIERLVGEDDQSVEAWYLGGWCLYLMLQSQKEESGDATPEDWLRLQLSSREWLRNCLKLYMLLDYEDDRLKEHAQELVVELDEALGNAEIDDDESDDDQRWEDQESIDEDTDDHEMHGA